MVLDSSLTFKNHVQKISKTITFSLHNFRHIRPSMILKATRIFVHAMVLLHIDYCFTIWTFSRDTTLKPHSPLLVTLLQVLVQVGWAGAVEWQRIYCHSVGWLISHQSDSGVAARGIWARTGEGIWAPRGVEEAQWVVWLYHPESTGLPRYSVCGPGSVGKEPQVGVELLPPRYPW